MTLPVQVFIFHHREDDAELNELTLHLTPFQNEGLIEYWHTELDQTGTNRAATGARKLSTAEIILLLFSPHLIADQDHRLRTEIGSAFNRKWCKQPRIIPIEVKRSVWRTALPEELKELKELKTLPAKPIYGCEDKNEAWAEVAEGVNAVAAELRKHRGWASKWYTQPWFFVHVLLPLFWHFFLLKKIKLILSKIADLLEALWEWLLKLCNGSRILAGLTPAGTSAVIVAAIYFLIRPPIVPPPPNHIQDLGPVVDASPPDDSGSRVDLASQPSELGMIRIMGGTFTMGSTEHDDEKPPHMVEVRTFLMDETEVTAEAFAAYVKLDPENRYPKHLGNPKHLEDPKLKDCNFGKPEKLKHPMNCVKFSEAQNYCQSLHKRLPTEEEWEYVARGIEGRTYPWGGESPEQEPSRLCWLPITKRDRELTRGKGNSGTCAVGAVRGDRTPEGVLDLAGNVREWVDGWYCSTGYPVESVERPDSPRQKCAHESLAVRGHAWGEQVSPDGHKQDKAVVQHYLRAVARHGYPPDTSYSRLGFRCAKEK